MPQEDKDKIKVLSKNLFPVVGIGASAGGLEAFKKLVKAIPENSGMAYILVQHLHPDHSSSLPEILQRETKIPVQEISDNVIVKPDNVYIIPSNNMLVATDGILQLSPRPSKDQKNMPIDVFFSSLAEVHQSHAIGIVLSGTGVDGTQGLKNIKAHGGLTFAEDLDSAAYGGMPQSAINAEVVDFILTPEKMPQQLLELNRTYKILSSKDVSTPEELSDEQNFRQVLSLLRTRSGVDFTYYKQTTVRRRILRRMIILKRERIIDYLDYLKQNNSEQDNLFRDILIPVTGFFRDPQIFENLCETIIPELVKDKSTLNPLRVWVAGCYTGEEAYSIGMCLHEYLSDKISNIKIQIFATDVSESSISRARVGIYNIRELEGVSDSRLQQFFTKSNGNYQFKKNIRDMFVFACHNFIKDPPFGKMDLITCRNVLIYMEPFLQNKALTTFHYALNEKGYLLLGKSETTGGSSDLFLPIGKKEKFFTRKDLPGRFMNVTSERREEVLKDKNYGLRSNERKKDDFQKNADDILLSKYTPAGVIVNEQMDIVQFRGSTGEFLEASPGKASLNIFKMAREGLAFELRNALHKAKITKEIFIKESIPINNGKKTITIEVIPLLNTIDLHFLVLFRNTLFGDVDMIGTNTEKEAKIKDEKNIRIQQLERDIIHAREDMRSITADQEAANEELQSSNEELLSGSEELQSLNEELETSKEELQSTNEELITVNQELFERNEQYNREKLYAEAIVTTIHEPLLVLSQDFRIKSANKSFFKIFQVAEEEAVGNVLFDLQNYGWNIPELRKHLVRIQKGEKFLEWELTYIFPLVGKRTICFNAQPIQKENDENWILLAFNDITERKERERIGKKNAEDLKTILEHIPQITATASPDGTITYFNKFFLDYSGLTFDDALDHGWKDVIKPENYEKMRKLWKHSVASGEDFKIELELKRKSDNLFRWHVCRASAILSDAGIPASWVGVATDIHDQKKQEQEKDEFIGIASHELKTPLTTAKAYIQLLEISMQNSNAKDLIFAQKACLSINRLNDLISELLDVSKIQNGKLNLNVTSFNFNEMLSAAIEDVQLSTTTHAIIESGIISAAFSGDKERLQQVVINLLTNAVKYSPRSDKVLVKVAEEKGEIKVSVTDSGIGIRKENLGKIFNRYYREEGRAVHFQGLGIGLSICLEIIKRHNGNIWAESEADKGSTFYFTIPFVSYE
jgi:two-component system CheB/CheR fusion protein